VTARRALALLVGLAGVVGLVGPGARRAAAQPTPGAAAPADAGYIGRDLTPLEIDDCKPIDLSRDEIRKQGSEH